MQNYFELFELAESFDVNAADVQRAYVQLQQRYHPDRMVGKSEAERAKSVQVAMDANEAYEALKNPLTRAQHLLGLRGLRVNVDGSDAVRPDSALLMEMMEMREQLADASSESEAARMVQDIRTAMTRCTDKLSELFAASQWDDAAQQTIRLRYLGKALEEAMMKQYQLKEQA